MQDLFRLNFARCNSGWQPQAQLGDGRTRKAVQPSPSPGDEDATPYETTNNVTRNLTYLNHALNFAFGRPPIEHPGCVDVCARDKRISVENWSSEFLLGGKGRPAIRTPPVWVFLFSSSAKQCQRAQPKQKNRRRLRHLCNVVLLSTVHKSSYIRFWTGAIERM